MAARMYNNRGVPPPFPPMHGGYGRDQRYGAGGGHVDFDIPPPATAGWNPPSDSDDENEFVERGRRMPRSHSRRGSFGTQPYDRETSFAGIREPFSHGPGAPRSYGHPEPLYEQEPDYRPPGWPEHWGPPTQPVTSDSWKRDLRRTQSFNNFARPGDDMYDPGGRLDDEPLLRRGGEPFIPQIIGEDQYGDHRHRHPSRHHRSRSRSRRPSTPWRANEPLDLEDDYEDFSGGLRPGYRPPSRAMSAYEHGAGYGPHPPMMPMMGPEYSPGMGIPHSPLTFHQLLWPNSALILDLSFGVLKADLMGMQYQQSIHQMFQSSATTPTKTELVIRCGLLPRWPILIHRSHGLTVSDVLSQVHAFMHTRVTQEEWASLNSAEVHDISRAFDRRCRRMGYAYQAERMNGVKRVDFLRARTMLSGITSNGFENLLHVGWPAGYA